MHCRTQILVVIISPGDLLGKVQELPDLLLAGGVEGRACARRAGKAVFALLDVPADPIGEEVLVGIVQHRKANIELILELDPPAQDELEELIGIL